MPFPEAFHSFFPISFLSENLHGKGRREFHPEVDVTQLFPVAFPLRRICPEGSPALYLPSTTCAASDSYIILISHLCWEKEKGF